MTHDIATDDYATTHVDSRDMPATGDRAPAFPHGPEVSSKAEAVLGAAVAETPQECFDKCIAAGDGTLGATHKCNQKCGTT